MHLFNSTYVTGNFADVYFDPTTFQDFTVTANVQKFYNGGNAVNLGSSCAMPTGSSPLVCQTGTLASPWNTNKGTGSGFTVTNGSLSAASSNPP